LTNSPWVFGDGKDKIDTPGALHHIIVRGIERRRVFYDDLDRGNFVESDLQSARENLESKYELKSKVYGFGWLTCYAAD
jgi:hypothetical protein